MKPVVTFTSRPVTRIVKCSTCFEDLDPWLHDEVFVITTRGLMGSYCRRCWWRTEVPHLESIGATVQRES